MNVIVVTGMTLREVLDSLGEEEVRVVERPYPVAVPAKERPPKPANDTEWKNSGHRPDPAPEYPDRKVCRQCFEERDRVLFVYEARTEDGLSRVCTVCRPAANRPLAPAPRVKRGKKSGYPAREKEEIRIPPDPAQLAAVASADHTDFSDLDESGSI